jgi:hypothetical protein
LTDPRERDNFLQDLEVKFKALELVVLCLLQAQDETTKQELLETARLIESQFHMMSRPGFHDEVSDHRRKLASAFAEIITRGLSGDGSITLH